MTLFFRSLAPHEIQRDTHERVKRKPYGAKHPARRRQERLCKLRVPRGDCGHRKNRTYNASALANRDRNGELKNFFHFFILSLRQRICSTVYTVRVRAPLRSRETSAALPKHQNSALLNTWTAFLARNENIFL